MVKEMTLRKALYVLGGIALILGTWGFYLRFSAGERDVNYGSYVPWGIWVAMYLFFAGVSTGAYMIATLDILFGVKLFKGIGRVALWGSLVTMPAALATIGMDLGHMERIWKVYLQPSFGSVMAQMVWGYTIFLGIILLSLWVIIYKPQAAWRNLLFSLGLFTAIFLSGGVGALLGVNASRAFWHVGLLPAQFPFFSLASGAALMLVILGWLSPTGDERRPQQLRVLGLMTVVLAILKLYFLWTDYSQTIYGGVPDTTQAVYAVLLGKYWWAFWFLQLGIGTVIPVVVLLQPRFSRDGRWAGAMGVLILVGFAVARANIIFPALVFPELEGLANAFYGPHLDYDYFPSLMEWSVVSGVIGAALLAFLAGTDYLPMLKEKSQESVQ